MHRSVIQSIANGCALLSAMIGVPSLTVLLLYAINELRAPGPMSSARPIANVNPDAISAAISFLTESFGNNVALLAGFGLVAAGLLWRLGHTLQFRAARDAESHPCLPVSLRG